MTGYLDALHEAFQLVPLGVDTVAGAPPPALLTTSHSEHDQLTDGEATAIRAAVADRGVIVIRGLNPSGAHGAAALADRLFPDEPVLDTGEHPQADDVEAVYRPVPYASDQTLLWHHEDSFNAVFPRVVMFVCHTPAEVGGATTVVDSRLVYQHMPPEAVALMSAEGVRYTRLCDGRIGRTWQQLYGIDDPDLARARAADNGETLTLEGDQARIVAVRPAFRQTPNGPAWLNQLLHWHPAALPDDLRALVRRGTIPSRRSCETGAGHSITDALVEHLTAVYQQHEFPIDWRAGDVLLVDNTAFAHGRRPFRGNREHFVRMIGREHHDPTPEPAAFQPSIDPATTEPA